MTSFLVAQSSAWLAGENADHAYSVLIFLSASPKRMIPQTIEKNGASDRN
jgi:hypothetical protein